MVVVYVYFYLLGVLYEYIIEVNFIYNDFFIWDSLGGVFYRYMVDVESYVKFDNFFVLFYIEIKNVGDLKRIMYVVVNLVYDLLYIRVIDL